MSINPLELARESIRKLLPYSSARDEYSGEASVFLDANESPYNSPYNRYPDPQHRKLKEKVSGIVGVDTSRIFLGNGSDEAIDILFRIFCQPGIDKVISMSPSYGMYKVSADVNEIEILEVKLNPDFSLNAVAILDAIHSGVKMIFLCSPNNPTANLLDTAEVLRIAENANCMVIVDEAYIDFSGSGGLVSYLDSYPNLVVLRTFSKAWGLAGIRLGMALADPSVIGLMHKVKYPYNLNMLTQEKALEELDKGKEKESWVDMILKERDRMRNALDKIPWVEKIYPSDANFLLVKMDKPLEVYDFLKSKGIIVRDRSRVTLCEGSLRLTIGSEEENNALLTEIANFTAL